MSADPQKWTDAEKEAYQKYKDDSRNTLRKAVYRDKNGNEAEPVGTENDKRDIRVNE